MEKGILYIQENKELARRFQERFAERGIDLLTAASASEALMVLGRQKILLLLVEYPMPDIRFEEFAERCGTYPDLVFAVCVEKDDPLIITTLVNQYKVKKLFLAPWDIDKIVDEIGDAFEHIRILEEQKEQWLLINKEKSEFEKTLNSLTDSLKKQQYSYYKLNGITQILLTQLREVRSSKKADSEEQYKIIEDIFTTMLKMRTTGSASIDSYESMLLHDLEQIEREYPTFHMVSLKCRLEGKMQKGKVADLRFVLWLLAKYGAVMLDECQMSVNSQMLNPGYAAFEIALGYTAKKKFSNLPKHLVNDLLDEYSVRWEHKELKNALVYQVEFETVSAGEHEYYSEKKV